MKNVRKWVSTESLESNASDYAIYKTNKQIPMELFSLRGFDTLILTEITKEEAPTSSMAGKPPYVQGSSGLITAV